MAVVGVLLLAFVASSAYAARPITDVAQGWVQTSSAGGCAAVCPGSSALSFRQFVGDSVRNLCASQTAGSWALGYEAQGQGCVTNVNGSVMTAPDYSCHCNAKDQLQGLALPAAGGSCTAACQSGFEGRTGVAVSKDGSGDACIPQSQIGNDNHFGTLSGGTCLAAVAGAPAASSSFSCVCLFGGSSLTVASPMAAAASLAAGGR